MPDERRHAQPLPDGTLLPVWRPGQDGPIPDRYCPDQLHRLRNSDRVAQGYASFIAKVTWHWFCHFTFDPKHESTKHGGVHPEKADKAFRYWVSCLNRELYGNNWSRKRHGGVMWARGQEFHKDGRIHFHALLAAPTGDLNRIARRLSWMDHWFKHFGLARIVRPESVDDVASYVSKYVSKGGEVDFSRNFGSWTVPAPDYTPPPSQLVTA